MHQFVAGYVFGPIAWGPASEIWGRKPIFLYPYIIYTALQIANALVNNLPGLLIIRFLSGVFASVPISNAGAVLSDIWDADRRGKSMSIFGLAPFAGPSIGPIISGYIQVSGAVSISPTFGGSTRG
jgi:MFS family permease